MKKYVDGKYVEMTAEEIEAMKAEQSVEFEIQELKDKLKNSDYQAIKYAEGWLSEEEYAPVKAKRQQWRDRINELEQEV